MGPQMGRCCCASQARLASPSLTLSHRQEEAVACLNEAACAQSPGTKLW